MSSSVLDPLLPDARPIKKVPSCTLASRRSLMSEKQDDEQQKPSVIASIVTLALTLPALLGTCCWPVLIAGFIGVTATAEAKVFSHTFSLAITAVVLTNLTQFVWSKASQKSGDLTHWQRYGPTYLLAAAIPLILADQVREREIAAPSVETDSRFPVRSATHFRTQISGLSREAPCTLTTVTQLLSTGV